MSQQLTKIHGFSTKTLTIPTQAGVNSYNLGQYQTDDFGKGSQVVAITFRYAKSGSYSIDHRPLISPGVVTKGYLNLVRKDPKNTNILFNHNLFMITTESVEQDSYGIFIPPCMINFNQSTVEFAPSVVFNGSEDLEFTFLFTTLCQEPIKPNLLFDNDFKYFAVKKKTIQIDAKANKSSFKIDRNPLSNCDKIIGLRYDEFTFETVDGKTGVSKGQAAPITIPPTPTIPNAIGASFLTLRVGTRLLMEDFPLTELRSLYHLGYPYFPIEPTNSEDFDWSKCVINVADKSLTRDNTCFLLTIYYI
jgi:hypothetical protein